MRSTEIPGWDNALPAWLVNETHEYLIDKFVNQQIAKRRAQETQATTIPESEQ